jgi:hypothetical protein
MLRAVGGQPFGADKQTLLVIFKSYLKPLLDYGDLLVIPTISKTNLDKLQVAQNDALRIVTGCLKMTPIRHLYLETGVLMVADHLELLSTQFLARDTSPMS